MIISKSSMSGRNGTSWRTFAASLVIAGVAAVGTVNATDTVKVDGPSGTIGNYVNLGLATADVHNKNTAKLTFTLSADQDGADHPQGTYSTYSFFDTNKTWSSGNLSFIGLTDLTITGDSEVRTVSKAGDMAIARVLRTGGIDNVTLNNLLITGGTHTFAGHSAGGGAGLADFAGAVIVTNSSFNENTAISTTDGAVGGGLWIAGETSSSKIAGVKQTANAHLTDVVISGNKLDAFGYTTSDDYAQGGGLFVGSLHTFTYGATTANGSSITDNEAKGGVYAQGGGLFICDIAKDASGNAGSVAVTDVTISGNQAISSKNAQGGGVYIEDNANGSTVPLGATFTFTDNTFINNQAISAGGIAQGGAIWTNGALTFIGTNTFDGNAAIANGSGNRADGGAICSTGILTIAGGTNIFENNKALGTGGGTGYGGALQSVAGVTITGGTNTFKNNEATNGGGAIEANIIDIAKDTATFEGNTAGGSGGAIFIRGGVGAESTIVSATFTENSAVQAGGAIRNGNGKTTINDSTFEYNKVTGGSGSNGGGAIYNTSDGELSINNSTFTKNTSVGAGGAIRNAGTLTITGSTFTENTSDGAGGAIVASPTSVVTITDSSFNNNSAVTLGGAIYASGTAASFGTLTINAVDGDVIFQGNTHGAVGSEINNDIHIAYMNIDLDANKDRTISFGGGVSGVGGITKTGAGTLVFEDGSINTYTGATTINDGTLKVARGASVGATGAVTVDASADGSTATLEIQDGAIFTAIPSGIELKDGGTLAVTAGDGNESGNVGSPASLTLSGTGGVINTAYGINLTVGPMTGGTGTISGGGALTKIGMGTLILTGNNTYSGSTIINAGTLSISANNNLGSTSDIKLNGGTLLGTDTFTLTTEDILVGEYGGTLAAASGKTMTIDGIIDGGGDLTIGDDANDGTVTLTGANIYSGATYVNNGTLALSNIGSIADSSGVTLKDSAKFDISDTTFGASINNLFSLSTSISDTSEVVLGSQTLTVSGGVFGGIFSGDGSSGITKIGDDDSLLLGGGSFATFIGTFWHKEGDVVLADGAALGGTYTQDSGATLTTLGNVTLGDATFAGTVNLDIDGNKKISATSVTLADGTLNITGYTPDEATPYTGPRKQQTVITTTGGVTGFDTSTLTIVDQTEADFLSASAALANEDKDVVVETSLTWYSTDLGSPAHGNFNITPAASTFTLGASLEDTADNGNWDGKSLTKLGAGTLILTAGNTYSGDTTISAGKLALSEAGSIAESSKLKLTSTTSIFDISGISNSSTAIQALEGATGTSIILGSNTLSVERGSFAGIINGSGGLTKTSDSTLAGGTLILTGTNAYTGKTTVDAGTLTIGSGSSLSVTAFLNQANAMVSVADGATFGVTGTLIVRANAQDLSTITTTATEFYFAKVEEGGGITATDANLDYSSISKLTYNTYYEENADHLMIAKKSANEIKYVSTSVAESLISYTPGDGNTFLDNVLITSTGDDYTDAERFELGYNMAGAIGVGFQTASAGSQFRNSVQQQLAGRAASVSLDEDCLGQATSMGFATTERAFWVTPMYGHQQASGLHSGDVKYGYASDQYGAAFGVEASQGKVRFGIAAQLGGGSATSEQTVAVRTKSESVFGGIGLYGAIPTGYIDVVSQLGWVGTSNKLKQTNGGANLSADVNGGLIFYSLGLEKTLRFGSAYVTPLVGLEYGYVYQGAFNTADAGGINVFKADKGGANMVTLPVGLRVGYEYNSLHPNGYGSFTPELSARFLPNVGDTELPYTTTPTGATAAKLRGLVGDKTAGDAALGLTWRGRATEVGVRYGVLFSERFTNQDASLMLRRTF